MVLYAKGSMCVAEMVVQRRGENVNVSVGKQGRRARESGCKMRERVPSGGKRAMKANRTRQEV